MYLNRTRDWNCCASRKRFATLPMKRHAYGGANLLLIAVPETCCFILRLNSKKLFFNTNSATLNKSVGNKSVGIDFFVLLI